MRTVHVTIGAAFWSVLLFGTANAATIAHIGLGQPAPAALLLVEDQMNSERIYSIIEYRANDKELQGKRVKIRGPLSGYAEENCFVGQGPERIGFDASQLPEPDRIKLITGTQEGIVTLDGAGHATRVEFQ